MMIRADRPRISKRPLRAVQINLMPWGTSSDPGHGPGLDYGSAIRILQQPTSGVFGSSNSIAFEVLNAQGVPVFGGAP